MEKVSLKNIPNETKITLLKELGYDSDGEFVIDSIGNKIKDRYVDVFIRIDNMVILPGSVIILDNNEVSISNYIEEFGDVF